MRHFTARRLALAALFPALFVLGVVPGCSNQGEGERCGDEVGASNNDDCGDNLVCTPSSQLLSGAIDGTNRCCYVGRVTDSRCTGTGTTSATGSTAGAPSSVVGGAGEAGASVGGVADEPAGAGGA